MVSAGRFPRVLPPASSLACSPGGINRAGGFGFAPDRGRLCKQAAERRSGRLARRSPVMVVSDHPRLLLHFGDPSFPGLCTFGRVQVYCVG